MDYYDYIVIGSGIAGLYTALLAKEHGSVLILSKGSIDDCNTKHAQGGIAAAISRDDSADVHFKDTIAAGAGLSNPEAVRILAKDAPDRITDLIKFGVPFDTFEGEIALTREAAHSTSRILHAGGDATGAHIELTLSHQIRLAKIRVLEYCLATQIVTDNKRVTGVRALDCHTGSIEEFGCRFLVLASGGAGCLFKYTTNPQVATADGIALAFNAGAEVSCMEFVQFHPTALRLPGTPPFLISEAVRGEGGILRNIEGRRFMGDYTPQKELACRDVVARSILYEIRKTGHEQVFLDVTHLPPNRITTRFPQIYRFCLDHGLDITRTPIPVAPAAHYMMGGVRTNVWGETNIGSMFAAGEVACTGVHGANRLASNSLMETIVFAKRIVQRTTTEKASPLPKEEIPCELYYLNKREVIKDVPPLKLSSLQSMMWEKVGILRSGNSLKEAVSILTTWEHNLETPTDRYSHELSNMVLTARLVTESALLREESRGAHFRLDFPELSPHWHKYLVFRKQ